MKLCLDTNAYSALKRGNQHVINLLENADEVLFPATVLGELYSGFFSGSLTENNLLELDEFLAKPGISIVEVEKETAYRYGFLIKELRKKGTPIPTNDIWIASAAMDAGAILLSNDKHFNEVPGLMIMDF